MCKVYGKVGQGLLTSIPPPWLQGGATARSSGWIRAAQPGCSTHCWSTDTGHFVFLPPGIFYLILSNLLTLVLLHYYYYYYCNSIHSLKANVTDLGVDNLV